MHSGPFGIFQPTRSGTPKPLTLQLRRAHGARLLALTVAVLPMLAGRLEAQAAKAARVILPDSVVEIPAHALATLGRPAPPQVVRTALSADEAATPMDIEVALRMRNFDELLARVQRGETIKRDDMAARYYPSATDYDTLVDWLRAQGLTVTRTASSRLGVFVRGPVSLIRDVFQVDFARVSYGGQEFTSAITAPSVPAGLAAALLGINGLQPHLRAHRLTNPGEYRPMFSNRPPFTPAEILKAYGAADLGLTGEGQIIAVVIDTFPADADLKSFWSACGVTQSVANIEKIPVVTGTLPSPSGEESLDVEWASSLAPKAKIRVYATKDLVSSYLNAAYQYITDDLPFFPNLNQVSLSYGIRESETSRSGRQSEAQYLANLASAGVTILVSSGDAGSNPDANENYDPTAAAQTELPASEVSVTAVGGTALTLDSTAGTITSETAWSGSGGGVSAYSLRPTWQTGPGVPAGSMRLVPDLAAIADTATGGFMIVNGTPHQVGGTSLSAPVMAGLCALINEARAAANRVPLGPLGPKIYPLIGTTSFRDITSGGNGAYAAAAGYDLATGIGSPNMSALVHVLAAANYAPEITTQPTTRAAQPGQVATFAMAAAANPEASYQWQRRAFGTTNWSNLSDNASYSGTGTPMLSVTHALEAMNGDAFRCVLTNVNGSVITEPAALLVNYSYTVTTLAGMAGPLGVGSTDGTTSGAQFRYPCDLAVDASGNIFVSDTYNHTIRRVTPAGVVTTLAGLAGVSGSADGTGTAARFAYPIGITIDGNANLYVADSFNHTIRKITPAGTVTTVAGGAGTSGSADGAGPAARFDLPCDVTVDGSGNLFVADTGNHAIRKIASDRTVSTLAGLAGASGNSDGAGGAARFNTPEGVAVDRAGNVFVADSENCTIRKIAPDGTVSTVAGRANVSGGADGVGDLARFNAPYDLVVDASGYVYVADSENNVIRRITPTGIVNTLCGVAGYSGSNDGTDGAARFKTPSGIALGSDGTIYIADTDNNLIRTAVGRAAPEILSQPLDQTVAAGASVHFAVSAIGLPTPSFQWYKSGAAIAGATQDALTLANVQAGDAGFYSVAISNTSGSVTSTAATLTVNTPIAWPATGSSGGGGGGALPAWFAGALALLGVARARARRTAGG